MLKSKLGLVKDLGTAFIAGAAQGLLSDAVVATGLTVGYNKVKNDDYDIQGSVKTGVMVAGSIAVGRGIINAIDKSGAIKSNYEIRKNEEQLVKAEFVVLDEEGEVVE